MSMDIGPGDWVEAADNAARQWCGSALLLVTEVFHGFVDPCLKCRSLDGGFRLRGLAAPDGRVWCVHHFRPIHRGNTNLIESLKEIAGKPLVCDPA